ncbi:MAG TPA: hypothetical protein DDZ96_00975, partial [Porphyromonadaceae bacterium]|nr:hypothetical protein [Porphyromonadaceae bacterium]
MKTRLGADTIAINFKSRKENLFHQPPNREVVVADVLVVIQPIGRDHCVAYVPYGPEMENPMKSFRGCSWRNCPNRSVRFYRKIASLSGT